MDDESNWGFGHLGGMPVTLSFGVLLLGVLVLLVILRVAFAGVKVEGGVR